MKNKKTKAEKVETAKTKPVSSDTAKSELASKIAGQVQSTDKGETPGFVPSSLPSNLAELYTQVEELQAIIDEKKLENQWMKDAIRPLSKIQRKKSGKKRTPAHRRTAMRTATHLNEVAIKEAENEAASIIKQFNASTESEKKVIANMKLRVNSQSGSYISRNKNNIKKRIEALVAKRAKNPNQAFRNLTEASSRRKTAELDFDTFFFSFLKQYDNELLVLCTGISSFKEEIWAHARSLFRRLQRQAR